MDKEDWIMQIGLMAIFVTCLWIYWAYAPNDEWKPWVGVTTVLALNALFKNYPRM